MKLIQLSDQDNKDFQTLIEQWTENRFIKMMKFYCQHGQVSTYDHCLQVAKIAFAMNRLFNLGADEQALVNGAVLHDFYLYDWHTHSREQMIYTEDEEMLMEINSLPDNSVTNAPMGVAIGSWTHSYKHPLAACENASKLFKLTKKEKDIIRTHMWPFSFWRLPKYRESWIVVMADKYCATNETIFLRGEWEPDVE